MFRKVNGFLILVCLVLVFVGCQSDTEKVDNEESPGAEQTQQQAEQTQQPTNGSEAASPDKPSGPDQWPADIPGYVPLPEGDVSEIKEAKSTDEYSQYYHIIFENTKDTADSYEEKLISHGWTIIVATDLDSIWQINANYNDGQAYLTVTWDNEEESGDFVLGVVR